MGKIPTSDCVKTMTWLENEMSIYAEDFFVEITATEKRCNHIQGEYRVSNVSRISFLFTPHGWTGKKLLVKWGGDQIINIFTMPLC